MIRSDKILICAVKFIVMTLLLSPSVSMALFPGPDGPESSAELQKATAPVEKISQGIFRIGDIFLDKKEKSISFPAQVNMEKGLIEYALVNRNGKTHESLFRTNIHPYDLQVAFLLIGFEGAGRPMQFQGAPEKPEGEPLDVTITYEKENGGKVTVRPADWLTKIENDKPSDAGTLKWVFTGSVIIDGRFLAQEEGSIIAVYHDPIALVNNASRGGESDEIWFIKEGVVPAVGTPVTVTLKPVK